MLFLGPPVGTKRQFQASQKRFPTHLGIPGFLFSPDVLVVVLDAQPEVDLHDLGWCRSRLLGVRGHNAI